MRKRILLATAFSVITDHRNQLLKYVPPTARNRIKQ
jgi:hypothetical protein